jgi:endonuclease/exonuclease/phosphatase (EEP) superfamily protein YafD
VEANKPRTTTSGVSYWGLIEAGAAILCVATVTAFLGSLGWILELTSHFRPHLAAALAMLGGLWLLRHRPGMAAVYAGFALINLAVLLPWIWPSSQPAQHDGPHLRLAAINVHTANERSDLVVDFLLATNADVILLMEVNDQWMTALQPLTGTHPYQISEPREDNFGITLFSRVPLSNANVMEWGDAEVPSLVATMTVNGREVALMGTHPLPPGTPAYARARNEQLNQIAAWAAQQTSLVIVLGDLNATPWSPFFTGLLQESGLRDTSRGRGLGGTWPALLPIGKIPLDHCLVSPAITVLDRRLGPRVGSDHLPLVVDLKIP